MNRRLGGYLLLLLAAWAVLVWTSRDTATPRPPPGVPVLQLRLGTKQRVRVQRALKRARANRRRDAQTDVWFPVRLLTPDQQARARIRLRGDGPRHWLADKVSWRVKLAAGALYRGSREFNLLAAHTRGYVLEMFAEWWSRRMGLVPCRTDIVWVDRGEAQSSGLYAFLEEFGKEQLEREGRPFSQVYKSAAAAEMFGARHVYDRRFVYSLPFFRQKCRGAPNTPAVNRLLSDLLRTFREAPGGLLSDADYRRLCHQMDMERWAAYSAVCRLLGAHAEGPDNVILYFNSSSSLFEPVLLDPSHAAPRSLELFDEPFAAGVVGFTPFTHDLLRVPAFRAERRRQLQRVLAGSAAFLERVTRSLSYAEVLARDPQLRDVNGNRFLASPAGVIRSYLQRTRDVYGNNVELIRSHLRQPSPPPPIFRELLPSAHPHLPPVLHAELRAWGADRELVLRHALRRPVHLVSLRATGSTRFERRWPEPGLALPIGQDTTVPLPRGFPLAPERLQVKATAPGAVRPLYVKTMPVTRDLTDLRHLRQPVAALLASAPGLKARLLPDRIVIPAGAHVLRKTLVLPRGRRVVLEAGAAIRFGPGVGLVSHAPLEIAGRPDRPVVLDELESGRGWGGVAVLAASRNVAQRASARSAVRHLRIARARGLTLNGITFTGGLSFFASDVDLRGVTFEDVGGDDALNVKRAHVSLRECLFLRSPSDAVDLDWCSGSVRDSRFLASGGDAIDLSGARDLVVSGNVVLGAGDKGVSVGERSKATIENNLLAVCGQGVASKDGSSATTRDNLFLHTETALTAFQKKPIFPGGRLRSTRDRFHACGPRSSKDRISTIELVDPRAGTNPGISDLPATARGGSRAALLDAARRLGSLLRPD